jgi:metallo-beta-lactamase family protein
LCLKYTAQKPGDPLNLGYNTLAAPARRNMRITFDGAARTVTGSQHLLNINGHSLLLECGFYQGRRQESYQRNRNFHFEPAKLDAVILSHAHIDHSGNLPNLINQGYDKLIYTTPATAHLANIMLMDSGHIQEEDAAFVSRRNLKKGEPPAVPLYTREQAALVAQYFNPIRYDTSFEPIPGVQARLVDAGHILGSAAVVLDIEEHGRKLRLWFSGDIGRRKLPLIRDPILPDRTDYLIMECTYGDKPHRDPDLAYEELRQVVRRTLERRGKVIIPAFAVGRTQEIVYALHQMIESRQLPSVPVYVDSPLAVNATDIFKMHPECFDEQTRAFIKADKHHTALGFDRLTYVRSVEESKSLNERKDPMIIIAASGMAEAGRILHHLRNNIGNPRNTVLIVSWQAPYTLGRRLADREKRVKIFGEEYTVKAEVATIGGLSAHAGQDFLREYALRVKDHVKKVFFVHGEARPAEALSEKLVEAGMDMPIYPELGQSVEL